MYSVEGAICSPRPDRLRHSWVNREWSPVTTEVMWPLMEARLTPALRSAHQPPTVMGATLKGEKLGSLNLELIDFLLSKETILRHNINLVEMLIFLFFVSSFPCLFSWNRSSRVQGRQWWEGSCQMFWNFLSGSVRVDSSQTRNEWELERSQPSL